MLAKKRIITSVCLALVLAAANAHARTPAVIAFTQEPGFCGTFAGGAEYTGESAMAKMRVDSKIAAIQR